MRSIVISSGHGLYVRGASGYLDEVNEARKIVNRVTEILLAAGAEVTFFHDNTSRTVDQNLKTIVAFHNSIKRDLDVSVHLNAYKPTTSPMGTEVLYVTQDKLAGSVSAAIAQAGSFKNRGPKKRTDLYFLNNTAMPALLLEVLFCDSKEDCRLYQEEFEAICRAIAATTGDVPIPEPKPPEAIPPDVPNIADWQVGIEATVFGGANDYNNSAYPPYAFISDEVLGVALPWKWPSEPRPKVVVRNDDNNAQTIAEIVDLGPWMVDDDYWTKGARPVAETCCNSGAALPSGPNKGKVPSNKAGIDLTPATAKALGIDGKGLVDWALIEA